MIFYELIFGHNPFDHENDFISLITYIKNDDDIQIPKNILLDTECTDLLKKMLTKDTIKRIDIKSIYENKWLNSTDDQIDIRDDFFIDYNCDDECEIFVIE